jgi:hypothetical protein
MLGTTKHEEEKEKHFSKKVSHGKLPLIVGVNIN